MERPSGTKTDAIVPEGQTILAHRFNGGNVEYPTLCRPGGTFDISPPF